jgi:hypothetical protein
MPEGSCALTQTIESKLDSPLAHPTETLGHLEVKAL